MPHREIFHKRFFENLAPAPKILAKHTKTPRVSALANMLATDKVWVRNESNGPNIQKEQFNIAYVGAIAAVAGVKILRSDVDDDSIDIGLVRAGGFAPQLDLQLKCTSDAFPEGGDTSFVLKMKNYDDLRRLTIVPRWLVVMYVPTDVPDWVSFAVPPTAAFACRFPCCRRWKPAIVLRRCAQLARKLLQSAKPTPFHQAQKPRF